MAPKSAAAVVLLAAMIAGLALPLQAGKEAAMIDVAGLALPPQVQIDAGTMDTFLIVVTKMLCSNDDGAMRTCARNIVERSIVASRGDKATRSLVAGQIIPLYCCRDFLKALTSGKERCACGLREVAAKLGIIEFDKGCARWFGKVAVRQVYVNRTCQAASNDGVLRAVRAGLMHGAGAFGGAG